MREVQIGTKVSEAELEVQEGRCDELMVMAEARRYAMTMTRIIRAEAKRQDLWDRAYGILRNEYEEARVAYAEAIEEYDRMGGEMLGGEAP